MKNGMKKTAAVVMAAMLMGTGAVVPAADYAVHPFKQWLLARIRKIRHARRHNAQDSCKKSGKKPKNVLQNKHTILYN